MATEDGRGESTIAKLDLFQDDFASAPAVETNDDAAEETNDAPEEQEVVSKPPVSGGKVTRTVDLGDGSGKQVFTANSAEELLDVMTTAQENATKKIREQAFELKRGERAKPDRTPARTFAKKDLTADELFAIATELPTNPAAAIDKIFKAQTSLTTAEIGSFIADFVVAQQIATADTKFLMNHQDDYIPNATNANRITKFLTDEKLAHTAENLEYAFQELTESELLEVAAPTDKVTVKPHQRNKPMSTGIQSKQVSGRQSEELKPAGAVSESDVEEIMRLPLEEARQKMAKLMHKAKASSGR
jgi:hypothetical protein